MASLTLDVESAEKLLGVMLFHALPSIVLLISDVSGFFGGTFENHPAIRIEAINSSSGIGRKIGFFQVSTRFLWMYMKLPNDVFGSLDGLCSGSCGNRTLASHTLPAAVHAHVEQLDSLLLIWALNRWQYGTYLTKLCLIGFKFLLQLRIYGFECHIDCKPHAYIFSFLSFLSSKQS
jgi:hypothetical protein